MTRKDKLMHSDNAFRQMNTADDSTITSDQATVLAVLEGGPQIAAAMRTRWVTPTEEKIKIMNGGGYEHFERVTQHGDHGPEDTIVFRWTMRTKMAE
jgi:hypothetical protein